MESWSSVAVAWMIQVLQVHKESSPPISIVIPGIQIPRWFINQSVGNSIWIEPISSVYDRDWIGIAFCAAFVTHDYPTNLSNHEGNYQFSCDILYKKVGHFHDIPVTIKKDLVTVEWVHLCLLYFTRQDIINVLRRQTEDIHDTDSIPLEVNFVPPNRIGLDLEVKNCGMRVVFKQDLEELNSIVTNVKNKAISVAFGQITWERGGRKII